MLVGCAHHLDEIKKLKPLVDLIEMRLDCFDNLSLLKKCDFPSIFTFRKAAQGGQKKIDETTRLQVLKKLLILEPMYLDIEADTDPAFIESVAKEYPNVKLIGSYHNFQETPQDLDTLLQGMFNPHFSIYKIAVMAGSTLDMLRLMLFAKSCKVPLAPISLGEYGKPSRVLAKVMGSALDYAGLSEDPFLQRYSLQTLHETFHYQRLNTETQIYALIGDPIEHSIGDLYHNANFSHNAVYLKMRVKPSELKEFFRLTGKLPITGLSVTRPLKELVLSQMDIVDKEALAIGAVNTVTRHQGKLIGSNTDAPGALNAIERHTVVKSKRVAILGAGGTARAIAYEAKKRGAHVLIFNRTFARARRIQDNLGCLAYPLGELGLQDYDILINTVPFESFFLPIRPKSIAMDVVYVPKETPFLLEAKKLGCVCIYGEEMFIEQANLQQNQWKK
jgi:3-dehydroquinate dehydratase/shikimate dehydrogenase